MKRRTSNLSFESLESRELKAADAFVADGQLKVTGTDSADHIVISQAFDRTGHQTIMVKIEDIATGGTVLQRTFVSPSFNRIEVKCLGGEDVAENNTNLTSFMFGGAGGDRLTGGSNYDVLYSGSEMNGSDDGVNTLFGGNGDDTLMGGSAKDIIFGEAGDDYIYGAGAHDELYGGANNDHLFGDGGDDELYGGDDNDYLFGGLGADTIYGENGDDYIYGKDETKGTDGDNYLNGGSGRDHIYGAAGNDNCLGRSGDDVIYGGDGDGDDDIDRGTAIE
jgi:Ca2+-binding RTX toxin-like protein